MKVDDDTVFPMVDFSYWNTAASADATEPTLDPLRMMDLGIKGVTLRVGKGIPENGSDFGVDRHFYKNVEKLVDYDMPWMGYWRIYDIWYEGPEEQAMRFVGILDSCGYDEKSAPVWIDAEEYVRDNRISLGRSLITSWVAKFMEVLSQAGYRHIGFYTRENWWDGNVSQNIGNMNGHPLWVAHWVSAGAHRDLLLDSYSDPNTWDEYVNHVMPNGPSIPKAWDNWTGWQFIGEGSKMGKNLGFASEHIDCNLVKAETFIKWFPEYLI